MSNVLLVFQEYQESSKVVLIPDVPDDDVELLRSVQGLILNGRVRQPMDSLEQCQHSILTTIGDNLAPAACWNGDKDGKWVKFIVDGAFVVPTDTICIRCGFA